MDEPTLPPLTGDPRRAEAQANLVNYELQMHIKRSRHFEREVTREVTLLWRWMLILMGLVIVMSSVTLYLALSI